MSTHRELRKAETVVLEAAIAVVASQTWRIPTNRRRVSVDAEHFGELGEACIELVKQRMNLEGDGAHNRTDTSVLASKLPGKSSLRRQVLNVLINRYHMYADGMTTDSVELRLNRAHTSVSSAMNYLLRHGLVVDSGLRRDTRAGSPATVYAPTELARKLALDEVKGEP